MAKQLNEFEQLDNFFSKIKLPESLQLDGGSFIPDLPLFVKNNLNVLRSGLMAERSAEGRYYRLNRVKELLSEVKTK